MFESSADKSGPQYYIRKCTWLKQCACSGSRCLPHGVRMGVGFMLRARVIRNFHTFLAYLPLVEADVSTSLALRVPDITKRAWGASGTPDGDPPGSWLSVAYYCSSRAWWVLITEKSNPCTCQPIIDPGLQGPCRPSRRIGVMLGAEARPATAVWF